MFLNFGRGYEEMTTPVTQPKVPEPTVEDCIRHNYDRREETKRRIHEVEEKQRNLARGETATKNEAHRAYLEKSYKNELDRLDKIYDDLHHERCEE